MFADRKLIGASGLIICLVAAGVWLKPVNPSLAFYTDPILLEFVFGIMIYRSWCWSCSAKPGVPPLAFLAAGIVLLVLQLERPVGEWRTLFWGVPAAAVLYGGLGALTFRVELLARLGEWSYALYLTHVFVVTFYIKHAISAVTTIELSWQMHYLVITVLAVLSAAVYHFIIEAPLSRWSLYMLRKGLLPGSARRLLSR